MDEELRQALRERLKERLRERLGASVAPPPVAGPPSPAPAATAVMEAPRPSPRGLGGAPWESGKVSQDAAPEDIWGPELGRQMVPRGGGGVREVAWRQIEQEFGRHLDQVPGPVLLGYMDRIEASGTPRKGLLDIAGELGATVALPVRLPIMAGVDVVAGKPESGDPLLNRTLSGFTHEAIMERQGGGWAGIAGFLADVLTDPQTWVGAKAITGARLSLAERQAISKLPGVTRVTPEGALTVAGRDTTIAEVLTKAAPKTPPVLPEPPPAPALSSPAASQPQAPSSASAPESARGATRGEAPSVPAGTGETPPRAPGTTPTAPPPIVTAKGVQGPLQPPAEFPNPASRLVQWVESGKKGYTGGPDFAAAAQGLQRKVRNIKGLSTSEGLKVQQAFTALDAEPTDAWEAIYSNHFHGTPIPEAIQTKYGPALPAMRETVSKYAAMREGIISLAPELKNEYPIFIKRPLSEEGAGAIQTGGKPTLPGVFERQDAYNTYAQGMTIETAQDLVSQLPPELRPLQPTAPGASKGLLVAVDDGVGIKWPDTPQGEAGQAEFSRLVENLRTQGVPGIKGVRLQHTTPIPLSESGRFSKNIPDVLTKTWAEGYRMKFTEDFLGSMIGMKDQGGRPLTMFVTADDAAKGLVPNGWVVMDNGARKWGPLNVAEVAGQKGYYAVRSDVAGYLQESIGHQSSMADFVHGALDAQARDATSGGRTSIFNRLWNKVVIDSGNGLIPFSPTKRAALKEIREYEATGIMPHEWQLAAERGVPLEVPDNIAGLLEDEEALLEKAISSKDPGVRYETGREWYRMATGSPLAQNPVGAAIGSAAQGVGRAALEGEGPLGMTIRAAAGAAETTAMRPVAKAFARDLLQSDLLSTYGAFKTHFQEFLAKGMSEEAAADAAAARTVRTTQAGQWAAGGGFSELIGGKPSGILGTQRSGVRAIQRAVFNRFMTWPENAVRVTINQAKESPKSAIGAALGFATLYGVKKALPEVAVRLGQVKREDKDALEAGRPWDVIVPTPWGARWISGRSMEHPVTNLPGSIREGAANIIGPGGNIAFEALGTATGEGRALFSGAPLQHDLPHQGRQEDPWEAFLKSTQTKVSSPWTPQSYLGQSVERQARDIIEPIPGQIPPSVPDLFVTPFLGQSRPVVAQETHDGLLRAFAAQWQDMESEARGVMAKTPDIPGLREHAVKQLRERRNALIREYLGKGLSQDELPEVE